VNNPKQVKPEAAITFTAVYCPSIVAMMYKGPPMRERVAVDKLTIYTAKTVSTRVAA
jgi:hypothetical protein